eukprot:m.226476 g.226476  ORF g.226476 m.226476 type:complete len:702 (+) comp11429_c0_seq1:244-2349(+)
MADTESGTRRATSCLGPCSLADACRSLISVRCLDNGTIRDFPAASLSQHEVAQVIDPVCPNLASVCPPHLASGMPWCGSASPTWCDLPLSTCDTISEDVISESSYISLICPWMHVVQIPDGVFPESAHMGLFSVVFLALIAIAAARTRPIEPPLFSSAKGGACAGCTIIVALVEQLAELDNKTIDAEVAQLCNRFPGPLKPLCKTLVDMFGPAIINLLEQKYNPDVVCNAIGLCGGGGCHLFPPPKEGLEAAIETAKDMLMANNMVMPDLLKDMPAICKLPGIKEICDIIYRWGNDHYPLDDADKDDFAPLSTFRGADWRGRDCDDSNPNFYPGRIPIDNDAVHDSNCNGIKGVDPVTNKTYEELFCSGTAHHGVAILGDSAAAHFHIPPIWMTSTYIASHNDTFNYVMDILENELDWPMLSATTGFTDSARYSPEISGPVNSTYLFTRSRNLCIHRDYQNIGVNGARAGSMNDTIMQTLARNQETDYPLSVMYALIGNDVCNGHPDTVADMTTEQEMHDEALSTMKYLDTVLPKGSQVTMMGLADGRILYETLHDRIHPLGSLRNDVTYSMVYEFLNCLSISPCRGWMNSNATLRNITTERAQNLSSVLNKLSQTEKFANFDLYYTENPLGPAIEQWVAQGGQAWQLIEPVDGFHPGQLAQPLIVDVVYKWVAANHPELLPPLNPNNAAISKIFGDQGGH